MKTIIVASSRLDQETIAIAMGRSSFEVSKLLSLGDGPAELWALERGIPVEHFEAPAELADSEAGSVRAQLMTDAAELLIIIGRVSDPEAQELVRAMELRGKQILVYLD